MFDCAKNNNFRFVTNEPKCKLYNREKQRRIMVTIRKSFKELLKTEKLWRGIYTLLCIYFIILWIQWLTFIKEINLKILDLGK